MLPIRKQIEDRVREALVAAFGEACAEVDPQVRPSGDPKFGDFQCNVAMGLAGRLKRKPREIAEAVVGALRIDPADVTVQGPDAESRAVRRFVSECLARELRIDGTELEIRKRGRIPELWTNGRCAAADLSLSHHGNVVGFACEIGGARSVWGDARASGTLP